MDIPESGVAVFTVFWILSISWNGQPNRISCLNICIQTFCSVGH